MFGLVGLCKIKNTARDLISEAASGSRSVTFEMNLCSYGLRQAFCFLFFLICCCLCFTGDATSRRYGSARSLKPWKFEGRTRWRYLDQITAAQWPRSPRSVGWRRRRRPAWLLVGGLKEHKILHAKEEQKHSSSDAYQAKVKSVHLRVTGTTSVEIL